MKICHLNTIGQSIYIDKSKFANSLSKVNKKGRHNNDAQKKLFLFCPNNC